MKTLVTGAAGFIGMHTCIALLKQKKMLLELIILIAIMILN